MKSQKEIRHDPKTEVTEIILGVIKENLKNKEKASLTELKGETRLSGQGALFDSLGLVQLLIDIEERVNERCGVLVALMDERAMSERRSPFITVDSLADYIVVSIEKKHA